MHRRVAALALIAFIGFAGVACDKSGTNTKTTDSTAVMPDVKGEKLDVALSDIKHAGFQDKVDIAGGGTFGVVVKSNWTVCDQLPAAGQTIKAPRLTVDRDCGGGTTTIYAPPTTEYVPPTTVYEPPPTEAYTPPPTAAPTQGGGATVQQNVHPGAYCSPDGARGQTSSGTPMVCKTTPSDSRDRWRSG